MQFHIRIFLALFILSIASSCSDMMFRKNLDIAVDDIPVYPNAQNVTREGPVSIGMGDVYIWSFTTKNAPDDVWQFYVDEMSSKWGFYGGSDYSLIVQSCPFYYLRMESTSIDNETYGIKIKFGEELCR